MYCPFCGRDKFNMDFFCDECKNKLDFDNFHMFILNPNFQSIINTTDEKYIYNGNDLFFVINNIEGNDIVFHVSKSINEAISKKESLIDDGWPVSSSLLNEEKITNNIIKKDDRFIVYKDKDNERIIFGEFDNKEDAIDFKYYLIENNWKLNKTNQRNKKSTYNEKDAIEGKSPEIIRLYYNLKNFILSSYNDINMDFAKNYFSFKFSNQIVVSAKIFSNSIKSWINLKKSKICDFNGLTRDVSDIGTPGPGNYEYIIRSEDDFDYFIKLFEQAYNEKIQGINIFDEATPNQEILDSYTSLLGSTSTNELNRIIFDLSAWEKIVFDAINKLNTDSFVIDDLMRFKKKFKVYYPKGDIFLKISENLVKLVDRGLLEEVSQFQYNILWDSSKI